MSGSRSPEPAGSDPRFVRDADGVASRTLSTLVDPATEAGRAALRGGLSLARLSALMLTHTEGALGATPYRAVRRVLPGPSSSLPSLDASDANTIPLRLADPVDLAKALRAELFGAVERAMQGARRVAVLGGGGVDSSAVLALACEVAKRRSDLEIVAVAFDFEGPGDDRPHMRALCKHLGVEPIRVTPAEAGRFVRPMLVADGAPYTWPSAGFERALAEAARKTGADLTLGGAGGDDLFDGDPRELASLFVRSPQAALRHARRLVISDADPQAPTRLRTRAGWLLRPLLAPLLPAPLRTRRRVREFGRWFPWAGPALRRALEEHAALAHAPDARATTPSERYLRLARSAHLAEVGTMRAQLACASGIPRRDPLLDPSLLEFVASVPPHHLFLGERMRGLFRESVRGLVPDSVRLRTDKASFETAQAEMIESAGGFAAFADLARVERSAALGLVEPSRFSRSFERLALAHASSRARSGADAELVPGADWLGIWPVLAVEAFLKSLPEEVIRASIRESTSPAGD